MSWVIIFIVVVIAAFAVPKLGKALLMIIGFIVVIGAIWYFDDQHEQELSKKRISPQEIKFLDLRLDEENYGDGNFKLVGRIKNGSPQYTLVDLKINITMRDCLKPGTCETIGQDDVSIMTEVPPGQIREIDQTVYFLSMPKPTGTYDWSYSILEIQGRKEKSSE